MYPRAILVFGNDTGIMGSSENPWAVGIVEKLKNSGSPHSRLSVGQKSGVFFSYDKAPGMKSWCHWDL